MPARKRIVVPLGMAQMLVEPAILTTSVGREFAVAVAARNGARGGGLINLVVSQHMAAGTNGETVPQRLLGFLQSVKAITGERDIGAVIVGGADTLAMMPAAAGLEWATRMAELLADAIHYAGIDVVRKDVGGRVSRLVTLDLANGAVNIEPLGKEPQSQQPARPQLPQSVEGDGSDFNVDIGAARVERSPNRLVAILGSCVGIALYDPTTRIGGLVHAAMPKHPDGDSDPMRYADTAVPSLLAQMQSQGADRSKVVAKIAGGAHTFPTADQPAWFTIPGDNVRRAREALARAEIPLLAEHVGGRSGRKILVDLRTFRVAVMWLDGGGTTASDGAA